jgi:hypothetical protein
LRADAARRWADSRTRDPDDGHLPDIAVSRGRDAVHIKPFHVDQLLALLDRFLAIDGPAS